MIQPPPLKAALKRGALVAAANWPLVVVQFVAEGTLKLLLAVPVVGGIILVVLLLGADVEDVLSGSVQQIVTAVFGALAANPAALAAFALAFLLVLVGGYALTFVTKSGTVAIMAEAEANAGAIERPPLRVEAMRRANLVGIDAYLDACRRLWRRYVRLGGCLLLVYIASGTLYLGFVVIGYRLAGTLGLILGWTVASAIAFGVLIVWFAIINVLYLLTQMVMAVEDVGVRRAIGRVTDFIRANLREVAGIFGVLFLLVFIAIAASILATAGLSLIAFVPLVGLAVLPLQAAAWLIRGIVFEYLALTALGAYLTQYRHYQRSREAAPGRDASLDVPGIRSA